MIQTISRKLLGSIFLLSSLIGSGVDAQPYEPSNIDKVLYFNADIKDAEYCSMVFSKENQQLLAVNKYNGKILSNPAMTCPDMFSWQLFANVIEDEFWSNWADEKQNWPNAPYALCKTGKNPQTDGCCEFGNSQNNQDHCPIYPGNASKDTFKDQMRSTRASFHGSSTSKEALERNIINAKNQLQSTNQSCSAVEINGKTIDVTKQIYAKFAPTNSQSIGRIIRQTSTEFTVRNKAFHDYLFKNNLYNTDGLLRVFNNNNANLENHAPYHMNNLSATTIPTQGAMGSLSRIDLPPDVIMIKSNWIHHKLIEKLAERFANNYINKITEAHGGKLNSSQQSELDKTLKQLKQPYQTNQFVHTAQISTDINLRALGITDDEQNCELIGTHDLVSFHISSKDIPNWVWSTFEHISLPGRCDLTGCNDSYGFKSTDKRPDGTADNYVAANQHSDNLSDGQVVFNNDAGYPIETIRPEWDSLLNQLNIGSIEQQGIEPSTTDKAWRNYRLKGSQVEFVNAKGMPTILGNSVTEAGFMDGSSCISCHSRATIAPNPNPVPGETAITYPLSMFQRDLSDFGYRRGAHGIPNPHWFYNDHSDTPKIEALQTDFIWGFLFAKDIVPVK